MGGPPSSQAVPLPTNLPFRIVSKTIGCGAYASIRKAIPPNRPTPVIAVKFINKDHAFRAGRLKPKQIHLELSAHKNVCPHPNIIRFLSNGEDDAWIWIALELAEGGDLFDKIEADEGVGEDVAHFYFTQLVGAVEWCHGRGLAHRDVKPENVLVSGEGDLKLADFGLATQFLELRSGKRKVCGMVCGSPPYIAPEILAVGKANAGAKRNGEEGGMRASYDPQATDLWSCAIVLFVLLAGNTPWDQPVAEESYEYYDYLRSNGRPGDELWEKIPSEAMSLVRGMLKVEVGERFGMGDVRRHPWFTRRNPHLSASGTAANPVGLATQMLESLHIDFTAEPPPPLGETMDIDPPTTRFASTQPDPPQAEISFDWEAPPRPGSQPLTTTTTTNLNLTHASLMDELAEDPTMSQFHLTPSVPLTLTQQARAFKDIVPAHSLARFLSILPPAQLLPMLTSALHRLNVPVPALAEGWRGGTTARIRIKTVDARQQPLQGEMVVESAGMSAGGSEVLEVRFLKSKGDPLGWRRFFKQVAVLCKEGIVRPSS